MSVIITTSDLPASFINASLKTQVVAAVNQYIETQTHRCWGDTKTVTGERYDYTSVIYLRHQDVQSVTDVALGWPGQTSYDLPNNGFYFDKRGRLTIYSNSLLAPRKFSGSALYNDYVSVSYTYGVAAEDVPADLKLAAIGIATNFYNYANAAGKDVVSASVGSYRLEYAGAVRGNGTSEPARNTSDANFAIVDSYRMRRM
jgi:hypothetical protein